MAIAGAANSPANHKPQKRNNMQYNIQKVEGATIFLLEGKLFNEPQTNELREAIQKEITGNMRHFVIDLKGMEFVNSACLNFLISARNKIIQNGGALVLCNVSDQLKRLLSVTKLESLFTTAGRTSEALNLLTGVKTS